MNFFRVHRLPLSQAPDTPAEPVVVDPAIAAVAAAAVGGDAPPADPLVVDPAATPAGTGDPPPAAAEGEPKPHGNKGKTPWYLGRISEESQEKEIERTGRLKAERERDEALALLQRGAADPNAAPARAPATNETDVETRAQQIAADRIAQTSIGKVIEAGVAKFPDWDDKAAMLSAVGAATPAFVLDVFSVDPANAHLILHQLADDPQKAAHLAKMDLRSRTAELVRMSMAAGQQTEPAPKTPAAAPRTVSKAPPPPPPIEPGSAQTIDWRSDKASDAEFSKGWDERQKQRARR